MRRNELRTVIGMWPVIAAACGGSLASTIQGSCDTRTSLQLCTDYQGQTSSDAQRLQTDCSLIGATWSSGACTRVSAIGGCHEKSTTVSGFQTTWFFPGNGHETVADVQAFCATSGGTYVAP
jgi:hypothetical protein